MPELGRAGCREGSGTIAGWVYGHRPSGVAWGEDGGEQEGWDEPPQSRQQLKTRKERRPARRPRRSPSTAACRGPRGDAGPRRAGRWNPSFVLHDAPLHLCLPSPSPSGPSTPSLLPTGPNLDAASSGTVPAAQGAVTRLLPWPKMPQDFGCALGTARRLGTTPCDLGPWEQVPVAKFPPSQRTYHFCTQDTSQSLKPKISPQQPWVLKSGSECVKFWGSEVTRSPHVEGTDPKGTFP